MKIADLGIATGDLADSAVTRSGAKLQDLGVATADIANLDDRQAAHLAVVRRRSPILRSRTPSLAPVRSTARRSRPAASPTSDLATDAVAADGLSTDGSTEVTNSAINADDRDRRRQGLRDRHRRGLVARVADAVGTSEIADLAVATADIANQAITNGRLGARRGYDD